ncbi:ComF family protein [Limosilactobacillus fastidiosus]|nr:ComF family protein [Limosilactobacillus fastidiosus]MCD7084463.1 ComF family protein [Limosilactobacillus fastidiosus]MCD7085042.1 ComF family protein [Limosilactobacillus fastidiosus]MCD7114554.1 ComF family protein [Limosilactobacillus fastidiosus]MCD7116558.1 ComF family protein [Limosilactobacillus fastidiosus]
MNELCDDCQKWRRHYGWYLEHYPLFYYNQAMKDFMQKYKFQGQYHLRGIFYETIKEAIARIKYDILIPIPVTKNTLLTRGYNQVTGMLGDIPYTELIIHQNHQKVAQSKKDRQSRLQTKQPFLLKQGVSLQGKTILLVDDIYTTGRTLYHAATLCYEHGSKRVQSLSLAR